MPQVISRERAVTLGLEATDVEELVTRLVTFTDALADEMSLRSDSHRNLATYLLTLLALETRPESAREIGQRAAELVDQLGERPQFGRIDNPDARLRDAKWAPSKLIATAAHLCATKAGTTHAWVLDELVNRRRGDEPHDRIDQPLKGWSWTGSPMSIAIEIASHESVVAGVAPAIGRIDSWHRLVREAIESYPEGYRPLQRRECDGHDPHVASALIDPGTWATLRRYLQEHEIEYALPLTTEHQATFVLRDTEVSLSKLYWRAAKAYEEHRKPLYWASVEAELAGEKFPETVVVEAAERTARGYRRAWVLSRYQMADQASSAADRVRHLRGAVAGVSMDSLFAVHFAGAQRLKGETWLRHCALAIAAAAFITIERYPPTSAMHVANSRLTDESHESGSD